MLEGQKREPWVRSVLLFLLGNTYDVLLPSFSLYPRDSRFGGSPDGILTDRVTGEPLALIEVKTRPGRHDTRGMVPVTHLVQMCGLLEIYNLPFAYYICSTYDESVQVARVEFDPECWAEIYRRLQLFAVLFDKRCKPTRAAPGEKDYLESFIRRHTRIISLPELESRMPPPESDQTEQSKRFCFE